MYQTQSLCAIKLLDMKKQNKAISTSQEKYWLIDIEQDIVTVREKKGKPNIKKITPKF